MLSYQDNMIILYCFSNWQYLCGNDKVNTDGDESRSVMSNSCNPIDNTVHGILQARILEWVVFPFSRGPRDWTQVSCISGGFLTSWTTREAQEYWSR